VLVLGVAQRVLCRGATIVCCALRDALAIDASFAGAIYAIVIRGARATTLNACATKIRIAKWFFVRAVARHRARRDRILLRKTSGEHHSKKTNCKMFSHSCS
jgi:hypothetical protein